MRGRTNITQRALPYVNGDVITAEVETGNTISVGDFVEYRTASAMSQATFDANDEIYYGHTSYKNNYIVVINKNSSYVANLEIWDKRTAERRNVFYITVETEYTFFDILPDDNIILCTLRNDTVNVICLSYDEVNNEFTIEDQKVYSMATDLWNGQAAANNQILLSICRLDLTHFVIFSFHNSSSYEWFATTIEYSQGSIGSIIKSSTFSGGRYFYPIKTMYNASVKVANNKIIIGTNIVAILLSFDNSYTVTSQQIEAISGSGTKGCFKIKENIIGGFAVGTSENCCIFYYDEINDIMQKYSYNANLKNTDYDLMILAGCVDNVFLFCNGYQSSGTGQHDRISFHRVEFNENTKEIKVTPELAIVKSYTWNIYMKIAFISNDGQRIKGYSLNKNSSGAHYNYEYNLQYSPSDDELSTGVDTTYIKSYNGGKAIGFAKTAGNSGESIKVYVPHQS